MWVSHKDYAGKWRRLIAATKRKGEVVDSMTTVVDLKGLTIGMITANTTKKFLSTITDIDQNYYPGNENATGPFFGFVLTSCV